MISILEGQPPQNKAESPIKTGGTICGKYYWLVVSTHLKNIRQIGSFPQVSGWKKN